MSFEIEGGYQGAHAVLSRLQLPRIAASVGGVESPVVHPADNFAHYMTEKEAESARMAPGLIRVSVGLEGSGDLISDFERALSGSRPAGDSRPALDKVAVAEAL